MQQVQHISNIQDAPHIPDSLIRDIIDGEVFYYKGYKEIVKKTKQAEDIMPSSGLQSLILEPILEVFYTKVDRKKYRMFTNESGNHLGKNNNMGLDIAIYSKKVLTPDKINKHYVNVPPEVVVEVDIKIDTNNHTDLEFINKKTEQLLKHGVSKVIWILSETQKVIVATPDKDWRIISWEKDIELINGHIFNIAQYLSQEGVNVKKG